MKAIELRAEQERREKEAKPIKTETNNDSATLDSKKDTMIATSCPTANCGTAMKEEPKEVKAECLQNRDKTDMPLSKKIIRTIWKTMMVILAIALIVLGGIGGVIGAGDFISGGLVLISGVFFFGARNLFEELKKSLVDFAIGVVCFILAMILL